MSHSGAVRRSRLSSSVVVTAVFVSAGGLLVAPAARAEEPAPVFGRTGQVVLPEIMGVRSGVPAQFAGLGLGGNVGPLSGQVGWGGVVGYAQSAWQQEITYPGAEQRVTVDSRSYWVTPAVDVFVGRGVSLGVSVGYLHTEQRFASTGTSRPWTYTGDAIGVSPRIGYVVPLARGLSLWPRLSIAAAYSEQAASGDQASFSMGRGASFSGGVDLGLVYQPIQRLMFKVSPQINVGRTINEARGTYQSAAAEELWVRVGGEATVGLVF